MPWMGLAATRRRCVPPSSTSTSRLRSRMWHKKSCGAPRCGQRFCSWRPTGTASDAQPGVHADSHQQSRCAAGDPHAHAGGRCPPGVSRGSTPAGYPHIPGGWSVSIKCRCAGMHVPQRCQFTRCRPMPHAHVSSSLLSCRTMKRGMQDLVGTTTEGHAAGRGALE